MSNQSGQGNPSLPLDIQSSRSGNPFNDRSLGDQTVFENPQYYFNDQAGNHRNYSSIPYLNDHYRRSEPLSPEQMIARSNRFNIPDIQNEDLEVPASLSIISPLNQGVIQVQQPNSEYFPSRDSRQSRSGQVSNYLLDFQASQARDQFTNSRREIS